MGSQHSKPGDPSGEAAAHQQHDESVLDRFRSVPVEDYNYIDVKKKNEDEKDVIVRIDRPAEGLAVSVLGAWQNKILKDPKNRLAFTALGTSDPRQVLNSHPIHNTTDQKIFNVKIPFEGAPLANQLSTGRCWLYASTNVFRVALMRRHNLDDFDLSQAYLFFWDKLEKSNYFLEQIIDTAPQDVDSRLVRTLMSDRNLVTDGGQWDMVCNLVEKYGLVPQSVYPDSWSALNPDVLNSVLRTKLREFATRLRALCRSSSNSSAANLSAAKDGMMREIYLMLTVLLGPPPGADRPFTWQYSDKYGKAQELRASPRSFSRNVFSPDFRITSGVIENMVSLVHDPRHDTRTLLQVDRLGNVLGGRSVSYVNVDMETIKSASIKMLRSGVPVFFGCDGDKFSDASSGIMDLRVFDYAAALNTSLLGMSKADRLRTGESKMTHAMVLTGVHVNEKTGKPTRWRVQNSWGAEEGDKGWFVMSDGWMDEFVYQAVVDPRFLSKEVRDVLKQEAVILPLWDPMGSLA